MASPLPAMIDWTVATERELPCPFAAGISARRHHASLANSATRGGLANVRTGMLIGSSAPRSGISGGITGETRPSSEAGSPMWKSAPSGPATSDANHCPIEVPVMRLTISPIR